MLRNRVARSLLVFDLRRKMLLGAFALVWLAGSTAVGLPDTWRHAGIAGAIGDVLIVCVALCLAVGIFNRKRFAWPLGFGMIGAAAFSFCWEIPAIAADFDYNPALVWGSSVCFIAVVIAWALVWYRQRPYFFTDERTA